MSELETCFANLRALNEAAKNLRGLGMKVEVRVEPRGSSEDIFTTMFGPRVARKSEPPPFHSVSDEVIPPRPSLRRTTRKNRPLKEPLEKALLAVGRRGTRAATLAKRLNRPIGAIYNAINRMPEVERANPGQRTARYRLRGAT